MSALPAAAESLAEKVKVTVTPLALGPALAFSPRKLALVRGLVELGQRCVRKLATETRHYHKTMSQKVHYENIYDFEEQNENMLCNYD